MGGILGWLVIHPANTVAVRLNLFSMANPTAPSPSFLTFFKDLVITVSPIVFQMC